jgi:hypothetical protein
LPVERDREVEPLLAGVLLLRDAVGEDVRVAMLANVRENLRCPTRHTPGAWVRRLEASGLWVVSAVHGAAKELNYGGRSRRSPGAPVRW